MYLATKALVHFTSSQPNMHHLALNVLSRQGVISEVGFYFHFRNTIQKMNLRYPEEMTEQYLSMESNRTVPEHGR